MVALSSSEQISQLSFENIKLREPAGVAGVDENKIASLTFVPLLYRAWAERSGSLNNILAGYGPQLITII